MSLRYAMAQHNGDRPLWVFPNGGGDARINRKSRLPRKPIIKEKYEQRAN